MSALPAVLEPIAAQRGSAAIFVDYDGTLSPTVPDPAQARPLPGAHDVLEALAASYARVAVVSGRPAALLDEWLGRPAGVRLIGLYGLESADRGTIVASERAEPWRAVLADATARARVEAPPGVLIEPKGLGLTLHWRADPAAERWVRRFAAQEQERSGLVTHPARLSLEFGPPLHTDKGTVVRSLMEAMTAGACFGDDVGDLPAFAALGELGQAGVAVARVAVVHPETPPEVPAAADLAVKGQEEAIALLARLAAA